MNTAHDFTQRLHDLLRDEHGALADFLLALAEFDERRLWVDLGHPSLFDFLHRELRLSRSAAFYRKTAAALIREFPEVGEALRNGSLCLMTVAEVARVLTAENRAEVLPQFFGLSKREAKALVSTLVPAEAPPVRDLVTPFRAAMAPVMARAVPTAAVPVLPVELASPSLPPGTEPARPVPDALPMTAEPLTAELNRMHVTVSRRFLEKLEAARDALSHSHPGAGMEEILEAGLDLVLERHAKRNGLVKKPRKEPRPSTDLDHVPAHVRRAVCERDGGRCQSPVASGGVCGSTLRVELHHRRSRHRGGAPTVENLTTLCGFHHDLETRKEFGDAFVGRIVREKRAGTPQAGPCS